MGLFSRKEFSEKDLRGKEERGKQKIQINFLFVEFYSEKFTLNYCRNFSTKTAKKVFFNKNSLYLRM